MLSHASNLGHKIKELLSDNGGEFDNEEVRTILKKEGITQKLTAPYTPEQNGGSERENRTIIGMARSFKYSNVEVDFPRTIWAELVNTAIYILNRTGKSSIKNVSPYEIWIGKKPRINHLRIIGSTCYAHIPVQKRRKMDKKAVKGYLIGYDGDERYRIYVKDKMNVILSRDVKFEEKLSNCEQRIDIPLEERNESNVQQKNDEENDITDESEEVTVEENKECSRYNLRSKQNTISFIDDTVLNAEELNNLLKTPDSYEEAINSNEKREWRKAMDSEINSLKENGTWELENLPPGAKALPCKWVYRIKTNPDGTVDRYKARLVIKGFNQRPGIDYRETFSPVVRLTTVRSILSIAAKEKMFLKQFDVSTAFLYGQLEETIFMKQPDGYTNETDKVCKLQRSLYGLKQAPRCWNKRLNSFLCKIGFTVNEADPCLYTRQKNANKLLLVLYVDDGLLAATCKSDLDDFIQELEKEFKITTKSATYFLGLEIETNPEGEIRVTQSSYARKILDRFNFSSCRPVSTPMEKSTEKETATIDNEDVSKSGKESNINLQFPYRQAVGALMYLMVGTRPDLAYSVGFLSRTLENPSHEDIKRLKRVFRYLAGTLNLGIIYKPNVLNELQCYSDSDFGGCTQTGRSTSGVVVIFAGGIISWMSQRQGMVATSTTEAEIVAANEATKEIIWLNRLFTSLIKLERVPILKVDNSAAVKLAENPEFHRRTKHIDVKHFFIREKVLEKRLNIQQIPTEEQIADVMTKALPKPRFSLLRSLMGLK